jgi:hypothetical protein
MDIIYSSDAFLRAELIKRIELSIPQNIRLFELKSNNLSNYFGQRNC